MASRRHRTRKHRTRRAHGAGYQTSQQFFDPSVLPPHVGPMAPVVSTAVSESAIRPVLLSTFQAGAGRRRGTRRARGGFNPSVMGPFVANAQAAIAPMAMYSTFRLFKNSKKSKKSMKSSKKSAKKSSRKSAH